MAIDVYLQIDGIEGESQDSAHQGWIELTSAQLGVTQPKSATASTAGGHTAERCEHRSITVTKLADLSSPILMQTCSAGKTLPKAKLEFMRADSDGKPVKYYEVELENVLIGSVNQVAHEGGLLQESVALKFQRSNGATPSKRSVAAPGATRLVAGIWQPIASRDGVLMPGFQPRDSRGFFMLPQAPEDAGYYVYGTPSEGAGQYSHPVLMTVLFFIEREWQASERRKFGIGNISLAGGGKFRPHDSHQDGLQVDLRPVRKDGAHVRVDYFQTGYDRLATAKLIGLFLAHPSVKKVYFNDNTIPGVLPMAGHNDHFHVAIQASAR